MKARKIIKFQYFRVKFHDENKIALYDLRQWIDSVVDLTLKERTITIKGYPSRLESAELLENRYIHMRFLKMTESFLPELAYDDSETVPLELEDDEYIAVDVNTIYDTVTHIIMVQNNRASLSAERIREYITQSGLDFEILNIGEFITFDPVKDNRNLNRLERKLYKKLEVHFDNVKSKSEFENNSIGEILRIIKSTGGNTGVLQIGLGRGYSNDGLLEGNTNIVINQVLNNECVSSANVIIKDDYETYKYDLFDNTMCDSKVFELETRTSLSCLVVRSAMVSLFKNHGDIFMPMLV